LTIRFGGNVHEKQAVDITSSSVNAASLEGRNAADWSSDTRFDSQNRPNSWLCYDFKHRSVQITHYSIRAGDVDHPRSWVLEGAASPWGGWTQLDSQSGNNQLNGNYLVATFPTSRSSAFRCIRFRQTGTNHRNMDFLTLAGLELFGHISE
jgi:hypothetical protein